MHTPPASPLHWNWEEGEAAILDNWNRGAANNAAVFPLPIRGGRWARGGYCFPRVRWEIYQKRNKNQCHEMKLRHLSMTIIYRILLKSSTVNSASRNSFLSNPLPRTLWFGIVSGFLDLSEICFIRM